MYWCKDIWLKEGQSLLTMECDLSTGQVVSHSTESMDSLSQIQPNMSDSNQLVATEQSVG